MYKIITENDLTIAANPMKNLIANVLLNVSNVEMKFQMNNQKRIKKIANFNNQKIHVYFKFKKKKHNVHYHYSL